MSLERVIAEQQKRIDNLDAQLLSAHKSLQTVFTKHDELFESFARLIDASLPKNEEQSKRYHKMRHECRMQMLNAGYCMSCYNFVCECEHDE